VTACFCVVLFFVVRGLAMSKTPVQVVLANSEKVSEIWLKIYQKRPSEYVITRIDSFIITCSLEKCMK
jgi:hypothetical protein